MLHRITIQTDVMVPNLYKITNSSERNTGLYDMAVEVLRVQILGFLDEIWVYRWEQISRKKNYEENPYDSSREKSFTRHIGISDWHIATY